MGIGVDSRPSVVAEGRWAGLTAACKGGEAKPGKDRGSVAAGLGRTSISGRVRGGRDEGIGVPDGTLGERRVPSPRGDGNPQRGKDRR